jgi:hypothetical protein
MAGGQPRQPRPSRNATTAGPPPHFDGWALALLLLGALLTALWVGGLAWLVVSWLAYTIAHLLVAA